MENLGIISILDEDNNVLISTSNNNMKEFQWIENMSKRDEICVVDGENDNIILIAFSNVSRLKYVSVIPKGLFWKEMNYIKGLIAIALVFFILITSALSIFFTMRNYAPIREILLNITEKAEIPFEQKDNEYTFIKNIIENILNKNEMIEEQLKKQVNMIKNDFLVKLLKGKVDDEEYARNVLETYNVRYSGDSFLVIIFYIEDYERLFEGYRSVSTREKLRTVSFVIENVIEELIKEDNECTMVEIDNNVLGYIINFNEAEKPDIQLKIKDSLIKAQEVLSNHIWIDFRCSLSGINKTFLGLSYCYQQAMDAMEYMMMFGIQRIICYEDIKKPRSNYNYYTEKESILINCIKNGNYERAKEIIDELFNDYFEGENVSIELGRCLIFSILNSIIKAIGYGDAISFIDEVKPVSTISECKTLDEIREKINEFLKFAYEYINSENKQDDTYHLVIRVSEYVKENYKDSNLNVQTVGIHFEMTPNYLSKKFKEQTGESLLTYINKVRLEEAKRLLKQGTLTIEKIAHETGHLSSIAFIRTFKKYEGITPGQYKKINSLP